MAATFFVAELMIICSNFPKLELEPPDFSVVSPP